MIIKVLVENTSVSKKYGCEHGLSLYIGTKNKKILLMLGLANCFIRMQKSLILELKILII